MGFRFSKNHQPRDDKTEHVNFVINDLRARALRRQQDTFMTMYNSVFMRQF